MRSQTERVYRADLASFCKFALVELRTGLPPTGHWHIDVMAEALQGCLDRGTRRLILNLPPRSLKSHCASVAMPVFALGRDPERKILIVAGSPALASDLHRRAVALMGAKRCQSLFPHLRPTLRGSEIVLPHGGGILYACVGQSVIGRGADTIIIDDPLSPSQALDAASRRAVNRWYDADIVPRLNDKGAGTIIVVMQRLHQEDLTGHVRAREAWDEVVLPAIALRDEIWRMHTRRPIVRKKRELLRPEYESAERLISILGTIGAFNFSAQYLQDPLLSEKTRRSVFFQSPRPENWTPDMGLGRMGFYLVPESHYILHDVFGVGEPPLRQSHGSPFTDEEWSQSLIIHQRKLLQASREAADA